MYMSFCFFNIILKILLTPVRFFCKILGVYIVKAKQKSFRKVEDKNYENLRTDDEILSEFEISKNLLPEFVQLGTQAGFVKSEILSKLNF